MSLRHRKRPRPKRGHSSVRKPAPEHPLDGLFRVLGVNPKRRPLNSNRPDAALHQPLRYGTSRL
jgi:hypothetical protein